MSMFKIPGRKSLDQVCKVHLLEQLRPPEIAAMWTERHRSLLQYWGRAISLEAYNVIQPRLEKCPYFIFPVFRDKGLFNVVTNFSQDLVGVSPLGEYQKKKDSTQVHMTLQFFGELARTKNIVLLRCEIKDEVFMRQDCIFVTQMLLKYYTLPHLYTDFVEVFNKNPNGFDYHRYLKHMKDEAKKDNIEIKDKKHELSLSAQKDLFGQVKSTVDMPAVNFESKVVLSGGEREEGEKTSGVQPPSK